MSAVLTLLNDEERAKWSDGEIAKRCALSQPFVSALRRRLKPALSEAEPRSFTTRHGTVSTMKGENIGRKPVEPAPEPPLRAASGPDRSIPLTAGPSFWGQRLRAS